MKTVLFYITYPIVYLVSSSPFWLLYRLSDVFYVLLFYLIGYRKRVVYTNLRNSFPEKSEKEIKNIGKNYYKYLCDLFMETIKTITWNEAMVKSRVKMNDVPFLNALFDEGKSILVVMGHLGNWEWAGPCFSVFCKHQLVVVYQPLSDPNAEKVLVKSRTKFNTLIVPRKNTLKSMIANRKKITATALIADQAPTPVNTATWMQFLNQDTAVFNGPEKIAKMLGYPVVYMDVDRVKRGYYEVTPKLLFDNPKETAEGEITSVFNKTLEESIKKRPETWLWSHRRWKHKRSSN